MVYRIYITVSGVGQVGKVQYRVVSKVESEKLRFQPVLTQETQNIPKKKNTGLGIQKKFIMLNRRCFFYLSNEKQNDYNYKIHSLHDFQKCLHAAQKCPPLFCSLKKH